LRGGHAIGVIPRQWFDNAIGVTHHPELVEGAKLIRPTPLAWPPPQDARKAYILIDGYFCDPIIHKT
jgi:hypothetical protein